MDRYLHPIPRSSAVICRGSDMKSSYIVAIVVVVSILTLWTVLFGISSKRPDIMSGLVGCYASSGTGELRKITITKFGILKYRNYETAIVPYEDKQSISLLPNNKVAIDSDGEIRFMDGNPFLLRVDPDNQGFTVLGDGGESMQFRRSTC